MTERGEVLAALEGEVGMLIHRVRRVIVERAQAVHPELSGSSYLLLGQLVEHGPLRSSTLVDTFGIDKGAVSRQIRQLVDLDLVERRPDPEDGRAQLLAVTDAAREAMAEVAGQRRKLLADRLADWTETDLRELVGALARYNRALTS